MAVSKVELTGGTVLIDLTNDTVTEEVLEEGVSAHNAQGVSIVGTGLPGRVRYDISQTLTDEQKQTARNNIGATSVNVHISPQTPTESDGVNGDIWLRVY